ncbi:MAG: Crp/Fnr family transcriptional regulator [Phycisphaerae bacterium]
MLPSNAIGELAMYFPFVGALAALDAAELARRASPFAEPRGAALADDASPSRLILLTRGCLRMTAARGARTGPTLYRVQPGETCGVTAAALLAGADASIAGTAETDVGGVQLAQADFLHFVEAQRSFRQFVYRSIAIGVGALVRRLCETSERTLAARLAELLSAGAPAIHRTHQELANELGTAREVVTRLLASFAERRVVRLGRGEIWVENIDVLRREAQRAGELPDSSGRPPRTKRRR